MVHVPHVKLSPERIRELSLLLVSAIDCMATANGYPIMLGYLGVFAKAHASIRLTEYFDAVENLIDNSIRNPLDHSRLKK